MVPRMTVASLLVMVLTACGSTTRVVRLDTGHGAPLEYRPRAADAPVEVDKAAFEESLTRLVLATRLTLRPPERGWLVRADYPGEDAFARALFLMSKSYSGRCKPGERGVTCLAELDAVGLDEWGRLGIALGFSLEPMKASIARTVERTLLPELVYGIITTGLITWVVLAANPEPVFTKAAAIVAVLMLAYLGVEVFIEVIDACRELKRAIDRAITVDELEHAGQRFADRTGTQVGRVAVLAITVAVSNGMVGGAALMASRLAMLPSFTEAALSGASQAGISLGAVGQVSAVSVVGKTVIIALPTSAVVAVAMNGEGAGGVEDEAAIEETGQDHHVISRPIAQALDKHATLKGRYTARDPRFIARAANKGAHNGYQHWHRDVDREVIRWLEEHEAATPEQFEAKLREIYNRPQMRARFPNGF